MRAKLDAMHRATAELRPQEFKIVHPKSATEPQISLEHSRDTSSLCSLLHNNDRA